MNFDRSKVIILLIIISMILFAAVALADLGTMISYILLVWIVLLMLFGLVARGIEE